MRNQVDSEKKYFLSFRLDKEIFAVSVYKVLEVLEDHVLTEEPKTPGYIKGVINFRGDILPVVDMRKKFFLPDYKDDDNYVVIVLDLKIGNQNFILGMKVDGVRDVIEINVREINKVPEMGRYYNADFMEGMFQFEDEFMMLLNIDKVFEFSDLVEMNQVIDYDINGN